MSKGISLLSNEFAVTLPNELLSEYVHVYEVEWAKEPCENSKLKIKDKYTQMKALIGNQAYLLDVDNDLIFTRELVLGVTESIGIKLGYKGKTSLHSISDKLVSMALGRVENTMVERGLDMIRLRPPNCNLALDIEDQGSEILLRPHSTVFFAKNTSFLAILEQRTDLNLTKGVVVETRHTGRVMKYTIVSFIQKQADEHEFEYEGRKITVAYYMEKEVNKWKQWTQEITRKKFPYLLVDRKGRLFPPELCYLHKDKYFHIARQGAPKQELSDIFVGRRLLESLAVSEYLKPFGASIQTKPQVSQGKVLAEAVLQYRNMTTMVANNGSWVLTGQKLLETPAVTVAIGVITFLEEAVEGEVVKTLAQGAKQFGLILNEDISVCTRVSSEATFETVRSISLDISRKLGPTSITFVLLPRRDERLYRMVKTAELFTGVPTQVVDVSQGERKPQYLHSLALQVNAKIPTLANSSTLRRSGCACGIQLGDLTIAKRKLMVVGVCRNGDRLFITASIDKFYSVFICQIVNAGNLSTAFNRILERFAILNRELPQHVLVLSETPRASDALEQLKELKAAQAVFSKSLVSFAAVRRPQHTRYFCEKPNEAEKKTGRVPVGAAVYRPHNWSAVFPICSSRPVEFSLLEDQIGAGEELDKFLFALCHVGGVATKSTAWPGVMMAAQKLERRWRLYVEQLGEPAAEKLVSEDVFQKNLQGLAFFA